MFRRADQTIIFTLAQNGDVNNIYAKVYTS